ncbi:hypothetical protein ACR8HR_22935, partial [Salmonella enterica subsp. enterica serovar Paratyphi A]
RDLFSVDRDDVGYFDLIGVTVAPARWDVLFCEVGCEAFFSFITVAIAKAKAGSLSSVLNEPSSFATE